MQRTRQIISAAAGLLLLMDAEVSGAAPRLSIQSGVELSWPTTSGYLYQPQWSAQSSGLGPWMDLGEPLAGDGMTNLLCEMAASGARYYRVLEFVPGSGPVSSIPVNGGFESGNGSSPDHWRVSGSHPPVRTGGDARSGMFSVRSALTNETPAPREGILDQFVAAQGGAVVGGQTYDFTFWAKQRSAGPSYLQQYRLEWRNTANAVVGAVGLANFNGGDGVWALVSVPGLAAPVNAVDVRVMFRFVTGAVSGGHGEVLIDDVALDLSGGPGPVVPGETNILQVTSRPVAHISWLTTPGIQYRAAATPDLGSGTWSPFAPVIVGDGGTQSVRAPMLAPAEFIRVESPEVVLLPPTNLRTIATGIANAIGLAWNPSPTVEVIGYRVLYGESSETLIHAIDVGEETTAIITGLTPGQLYYLAVIAYTAEDSSLPGDAILSAEAEENPGMVALFDPGTPLEPPTTLDTPDALITRVADRPRDRHAREGMFNAYDHYLTFYWEHRTVAIEIVDTVAKGGTNITFHFSTLWPLKPSDFRAFFRGITTVAEYHTNLRVEELGLNQYRAVITRNTAANRALRVGDRMEFEFSPFLEGPPNGRENYYGTAMLYMIGQGIVPWQGVGPLLDSFPLPEAAWLGGQTTLPYQYSNEPEHRFKQMAGNMAPTNAQPFMLGRRLHHTDFGSGAHSEPGNPLMSEQIGKLGPKFIARSCVECHVNNGRALPPALGAPMYQTVVKVGQDASGSPHPVLGAVLQPQSVGGPSEGAATLAGYTDVLGQFADGTLYSLRKPIYSFDGVTPSHFSARLAPPLVGLGLLEAVSESTVLALADPDDANADGISGRAHTVLDPETGQWRLGRFTYKAGKACLSHQIAAALNRDMGVTTDIFPRLDGELTAGAIELAAGDLDFMTRYVAVLGVGARRDLTDAEALSGEERFADAQCVQCHTPNLTTSPYHPMTELRGQTIHPYTDLLLHDMGPGLADNMGEEGAIGSEWRTAPLWSIGLTAGVSGGEAYLHDGRARSLEEAILWHGGEAEASREAFRAMAAADRAALIKFLKSL